jgi:hypothetical protein
LTWLSRPTALGAAASVRMTMRTSRARKLLDGSTAPVAACYPANKYGPLRSPLSSGAPNRLLCALQISATSVGRCQLARSQHATVDFAAPDRGAATFTSLPTLKESDCLKQIRKAANNVVGLYTLLFLRPLV